MYKFSLFVFDTLYFLAHVALLLFMGFLWLCVASLPKK